MSKGVKNLIVLLMIIIILIILFLFLTPDYFIIISYFITIAYCFYTFVFKEKKKKLSSYNFNISMDNLKDILLKKGFELKNNFKSDYNSELYVKKTFNKLYSLIIIYNLEENQTGDTYKEVKTFLKGEDADLNKYIELNFATIVVTKENNLQTSKYIYSIDYQNPVFSTVSNKGGEFFISLLVLLNDRKIVFANPFDGPGLGYYKKLKRLLLYIIKEGVK